MYQILTDQDIEAILPMRNAVEVIEKAIRSKSENELLAPPRFSVGTKDRSLVFTVGSEMKYFHTIGFRVYDRFPSEAPDRTQLVAVFDNQTGGFKGLVIGKTVGALRTATINAVAIKHMARSDTKCLGILGAGFQATYHALAALSVRDFDTVKVYSPTAARREAFAEEMQAKASVPFEACSTSIDVVRNSDVLICVTTSPIPVFNADWLKPGVHINSVGPKYKNMHELPLQAVERSQVIATDSIKQAGSYDKSHFLSDRPEWNRFLELGDIVAGKKEGRITDQDITIFCSVGLSGTEVVIANEAIRLATEQMDGEPVPLNDSRLIHPKIARDESSST